MVAPRAAVVLGAFHQHLFAIAEYGDFHLWAGILVPIDPDEVVLQFPGLYWSPMAPRHPIARRLQAEPRCRPTADAAVHVATQLLHHPCLDILQFACESFIDVSP